MRIGFGGILSTATIAVKISIKKGSDGMVKTMPDKATKQVWWYIDCSKKYASMVGEAVESYGYYGCIVDLAEELRNIFDGRRDTADADWESIAEELMDIYGVWLNEEEEEQS